MKSKSTGSKKVRPGKKSPGNSKSAGSRKPEIRTEPGKISPATIQFLKGLKKNNNREWFHAHKDEYDAAATEFVGFVRVLIERLTKVDPTLSQVSPAECLFRIYRDVRFSSDKSPYKPHLSAFIAVGGRKSRYAGYYVHIQPGYNFMGGGVYHPEAEELESIRRAIASRGGELRKIINNQTFKKSFKEMEGDRLKRVPRAYSEDHPMADLICWKDFIVSRSIPDAILTKDLIGECIKHFKILKPFNVWLSRAVGEPSVRTAG
ncbi:MAG: DUF2461 domain-containing protein [Leptospirales bacterium]|nr:DUF2461 domain-containing protein [Leptospirales bacterium]